MVSDRFKTLRILSNVQPLNHYQSINTISTSSACGNKFNYLKNLIETSFSHSSTHKSTTTLQQHPNSLVAVHSKPSISNTQNGS
jgi:hypothetical protein